MGNLYNNIASLCEKHNIKGAKLCDDIGISKGLLTDLKMGRRTGVSAVTAQKIASYFGVSVGYLLGEEDKKEEPNKTDGLSEADKAFFELLKTATDEEKQMLYDIMQTVIDRRKK